MPCRVVVLGAGISGLTYAWYLKKRLGPSVDIILLEKEQRVGGWIRTTHSNGFIFENGPRSCRTRGSGAATLRLIEELGLQDKVIVGNAASHKRYLYTNGKLQKFPGLLTFAFSSLTRNLIPALCKEYFIPKGSNTDESIYSFFSRRLNSNLTELFIDPLVSGIYAGDLRKLSIEACFPSFYQLEQEYGSILKGMLWGRKKKDIITSSFTKSVQKSAIFSFKEGMDTLIKELAHQLEGEIKLGCFPKSLEINRDGIKLKLEDQKIIEADFVFSAIPMPEIGKLLNISYNLQQQMIHFPYSSVAVVNLGYRKQLLKQKGFGYLIPSIEKEDILGCVWDSSIFPQQNEINQTRLTVMIRGIQKLSKEEYINRAIQAVGRHLGIEVLPDSSMLFHAKESIPQYEVGYMAFLNELKKDLGLLNSRLILSGNAFTGVSVNDCIASSYEKSKTSIVPSVLST